MQANASVMARLFASGHAVDIVLAVIALELVWLVTRRGWCPIDAILGLGPGVLMLIAVRAALTGQDWQWIASTLILSFPIHLLDLANRSQRIVRPGVRNRRAGRSIRNSTSDRRSRRRASADR